MSKILILGATGYLGNNVANSLVQSDQHTVYSVARSHEKGLQLARQEITPVLSTNPVEDTEPYLSVIRSENIEITKAWLDLLLRDMGPRLLSQGHELSLRRGSGSTAPELFAWRVDLEKQILDAADVLDAIILRPALLYGRELTILSPFVTPLLAQRGVERRHWLRSLWTWTQDRVWYISMTQHEPFSVLLRSYPATPERAYTLFLTWLPAMRRA
ncbi:hypothetical protein CNMCM5793_007951 [Aspergillus hiratsukae]|uniref:NAD(P)-binding domain-containing protein n=1 Tax=Aspergillus hiratsukae TaxID=1194566 RepID=A0A8H6P7F8_9EURO|nr:hypothetical protein CNMCM5793_007951 [Aspergillus hiratsukae]